jgi:hypothetical protein
MQVVATKHSAVPKTELIKAIQNLEVNLSINQSAARNMGENTVKEAQDLLRNLDLRSFVSDCEEAFRKRLDEVTVEFSGKLSNKSWGATRKFLNIFLRAAVYNRHLCDYYDLAMVEPFLEVPLDSQVAKALRNAGNTAEGGLFLPAWRTIIGLKPEISQKYQDVVSKVAKAKCLARVHLDAWYWRSSGEKPMDEVDSEEIA